MEIVSPDLPLVLFSYTVPMLDLQIRAVTIAEVRIDDKRAALKSLEIPNLGLSTFFRSGLEVPKLLGLGIGAASGVSILWRVADPVRRTATVPDSFSHKHARWR